MTRRSYGLSQSYQPLIFTYFAQALSVVSSSKSLQGCSSSKQQQVTVNITEAAAEAIITEVQAEEDGMKVKNIKQDQTQVFVVESENW